jgi:hypothetical protein
MGKTRRTSKAEGRERRISVRGVRRDQPDLQKLGRALIILAQAEQAAQAEHEKHELHHEDGEARSA